MLKRIAVAIKELIYPPACRVCGRRLIDDETFLCGDCLFETPLTMQCDYPYKNFMHDKFQGVVVERACCYFLYKRGSDHKKIIKAIKFGGDRPLGLRMGVLFGTAIEGSDEFKDIDFVVPVPLHKRRLRDRGYNQSELIGKGIADALGVPMVTTAVKRVRSTKPQSTLLHDLDRRENMQGAFQVVDTEIFKDKKILIVDDVTTTGETISSLVRTIRRTYKQIEINVATLSATPMEKRGG